MNWSSLVRALLLLLVLLYEVDSKHVRRKHTIKHRHWRHKRQGRGGRREVSVQIGDAPSPYEEGPWGEWTYTSECSRTCGGGVIYQERYCLINNPDGTAPCKGPNRKYKSCATQDCSSLTKDFRALQCSHYDNELFGGRYYTWVPYTKNTNKCELTCMPKGERFYYRHTRKVVDGTRCDEDSLDVCVDGVCQSVGCDRQLGSSAREDKCRVCGGDGSSCRTIPGTFRDHDLQVGYNDILLVPKGATNIYIKERKASNNYLAVRNATGHYYLNGNWRIDFPRSLRFAGTMFHYERKPDSFFSPESLRAIGPTTESLFAVLLYQEPNIEIDYEYSIPTGVSSASSDNYKWFVGSYSSCSAPCGGGFQTRYISCGRASSDGANPEVLENTLCEPLLQPPSNRSCNEQPCPASWHIGDWTECEEDCEGGDGLRFRQVYCMQVVALSLPSVVPDDVCVQGYGPKPKAVEKCGDEDDVKKKEYRGKYFTGPWSPCNKLCGKGTKSRRVTCYMKNDDNSVEILENSECEGKKPPEEEECEKPPCSGVDWVSGDWTGCGSKCGLTFETRPVYCSSPEGEVVKDEFCHEYRKPESTRNCSEVESCPHAWYTSSWSECSSDCGPGEKTRSVFCGKEENDCIAKAPDEDCASLADKPEDTEACNGTKEECKGHWVSGPWDKCTKKCDEGEQKRKIFCFKDRKKVHVDNCEKDDILPTLQSCNEISCEDLSTTVETPPTDTTVVAATTPMATTESAFTMTTESEANMTTGSEATMTTGTETTGTEVTVTESTGNITEISSTEPSNVTVTESTGNMTEIPSTEPSNVTVTDEATMADNATEETMATVTEGNVTEATMDVTTGMDNVTEASVAAVNETELTTVQDVNATETTQGSSTTMEASGNATDTTTMESTTMANETTTTATETTTTATDTTTESTTTTIMDPTTRKPIIIKDEVLLTIPPQDAMDDTEETGSGDAITTFEITDEMENVSSTTPSSTEETSFSSTLSTLLTTMISSTMEAFSGSTSEEGNVTETESTSNETMETSTPVMDANLTTVFENITTVTQESQTTSNETETTPATETTDNVTDITSTMATETTHTTDNVTETTVSEITETEGNVTTDTTMTGTTMAVKATTPVSVATTWDPRVDTRTMCPKDCYCQTTEFGCCYDGVTPATGPFSAGCSIPETCEESEFGCCYDDVSRALGTNYEGCPPSQCQMTLFGCCPDKLKTAQGNNEEGCSCEESKFGCCHDNSTAAQGADMKGCPPPVTEPSTIPPVTEPTVVNCSDSTFGCCLDGKMAATGPNMEGCEEINCTDAQYGCCDDNVTAALGPEGEGCEPECANSTYGCCPDRMLQAHGPNNEGCCITSPFGCCPDNIRPAKGSNLEGCECQSSAYGCCPDNQTAARGPEFAGCGCQYSAYGCCPDDYTPAEGRDFHGCDCQTYEYGCCPDGYTVAKGPNLEGCGCEEKEFGCCEDGRTPARGPQYEGCGCEASRYGCCPDGYYAAKGENFEGCSNVPTALRSKAVCSLKDERGTCRNFTVRWFFDMEYGGCAKFWYGGCDGNGNNFESMADCEAVCIQPETPEACELPSVGGICDSYELYWYYDSENSVCRQFYYGGCLGNNNRFATEKECQAACHKDYRDVCSNEMDAGPCNGQFRRWYYDQNSESCREFVYGGCKGNENNFLSEVGCKQRCFREEGTRSICLQPRTRGPCDDNLSRWYFDRAEDRCMPFYFSGCGGNSNNFVSQKECDTTCPPLNEQPENLCSLSANPGPCDDYKERWYYSATEGYCQRFMYGGCGGNGNNFATREECQSQCHNKTKPVDFQREWCLEEMDIGPCSDNIPQYYYDRSDGVCKHFYWGGCEGTRNRFQSRVECKKKCSEVQDICNLPRVVGPCSGNSRKYYYEPNNDECFSFDFSGCVGNENNFETIEDCRQRCKKRTDEVPVEPPVPEATQRPPAEPQPLPPKNRMCSLPLDNGACHLEIPSWFFNTQTGRCEAFVYGGCQGNANRFSTEEACDRQCGAFRDQEVCNVDPDPGPCRGEIEKWYFDPIKVECSIFYYGGCEGNANRFSTLTECETVCIAEDIFRPKANDTRVIKEEICALPMEAGQCAGDQPRWYYNRAADECTVFTYTGCNGNPNRFKTFKACTDYCGRPEERYPPPENAGPCYQEQLRCRDIKCAYGIEEYVDSNGCEKCDCRDPCRSHSCPEGTACAVAQYPSEDGFDPSARAVCRSIDKNGECPLMDLSTGEQSACRTDCHTDADCAADRKCCASGCGYTCVNPILPREPTQPATERPPDAQPPRIVSADSQVEAEEGSLSTLRCIVQGIPQPTVIWWKGNQQVLGDEGRIKVMVDGSLQISGVRRTDAGSYTCVADNGVGRPAERTIRLDVIDGTDTPAAIVQGPPYLVSTLGTPTIIFCTSWGWPRPTISWWRYDRRIPSSSQRYQIDREGTLKIRLLTLRDLGEYTCESFNGIGKSATLKVVVQAIGPIYDLPENAKNISRYLVAKPEPIPGEEPEPGRPIRKKPRPSGPRDPYVPYLTRGPERRTTQRTTRRTTQRTTPPTFVPVAVEIPLTETEFNPHINISIPCRVQGYPLPLVTWFKGDNRKGQSREIVRSHHHEILADNTLVIFNSSGSDSDIYSCQATNNFNTAIASVAITVQGIYIHPNCTDNNFFANCNLIVSTGYCSNQPYYARFCCRSCTLAGHLPSIGPHLKNYNTAYFTGLKTETRTRG